MQARGWTCLRIRPRTALTYYSERSYGKGGTHGWNTSGQLSGFTHWISASVQLTVSTWCAASAGGEENQEASNILNHKKVDANPQEMNFQTQKDERLCCLLTPSLQTKVHLHSPLPTNYWVSKNRICEWIKFPHFIHSCSWGLRAINNSCSIWKTQIK